MAKLNEFVTKDAVEIRDDQLRTIKNGLIKQGVASPYVGPNSDWYLIATSIGNELAVVHANTIVKADQQMPDTAVEADLARIAALWKRAKQGAAGSIGNVIITASATSPIVSGAELTDSLGLRYAVVTGGNYANGDSVPIRAIDVGDDTNHAEGDVLTWVSAPPYCDDKVTVDSGGLVNGINTEDDEVLRARVLDLLGTPPGAGNWEHVVELAEESTSSVQKAFVYPAVGGPATVHVAVAAAPTATSKSRALASTTLNAEVAPYVTGKLPRGAAITSTTVTDVNVDLAIGLSIPESLTANPPGPGGGWTNGTPWPSVDGTTTFAVSVTVATDSTNFTVDAQTAPTAGVTRIAWLSTVDWKVKTALVTAFSGSAGAYAITIDTPFTGIGVGAFIWPECQNAETYAQAVLDAFALMGPGEKTSNASALTRGFRHPIPLNSWPYSIGPAMERAVTDSGDEVLSTAFLYRSDGTVTLNGSGSSLTPQVPAALTDAPNIYIPRHIAFYRRA